MKVWEECEECYGEGGHWVEVDNPPPSTPWGVVFNLIGVAWGLPCWTREEWIRAPILEAIKRMQNEICRVFPSQEFIADKVFPEISKTLL